jgi:hypothetical protein
VGLIIIAAALAVGWLGWSWWLAIPLGLVFYIQTYRENPERATRFASSAWLTAPLYALFFIWLGSFIQGAISN